MRSVMLDIESLGDGVNGAVISLAAVLFDTESVYTVDEVKNLPAFRENILIQSTLDIGLEVDGPTVTFWLEQEPEARGALFVPTPRHIKPVLRDFVKWWEVVKPEYIWSHATFDIPLLSNAFRKSEIKIPWEFRKALDLRTIKRTALVLGVSEFVYSTEFVKHDPSDDARHQILEFQHYWQGIRSMAR